MNRVREAVDNVPGFAKWSHADKLRFFAWVLHAEGREHLKAPDFFSCYDAVDLPRPGDLYSNLRALEKQGDLLSSAHGLRLAKPSRDALEMKYGNRPVTVQVHELLDKLPTKLTVAAQREYLDEAIKCLRVGAWRAAIIMAWNLGYNHLCGHIVGHRLNDFHVGHRQAFQNKKAVTIFKRSDLQDLKESEVITACRAGGITDGTQHKCLERNLGIRNDAAHPSGATFNQVRTEAFISEVVETIVLRLQ